MTAVRPRRETKPQRGGDKADQGSNERSAKRPELQGKTSGCQPDRGTQRRPDRRRGECTSERNSAHECPRRDRSDYGAEGGTVGGSHRGTLCDTPASDTQNERPHCDERSANGAAHDRPDGCNAEGDYGGAAETHLIRMGRE